VEDLAALGVALDADLPLAGIGRGAQGLTRTAREVQATSLS
jgi:hypothetical protein